MRLASLLVVVSAIGCSRPNFVQLVPVQLDDDPSNLSGGPAGYSCRLPCPCADGSTCSCLLFERAAEEARSSDLNPAFWGPVATGSAIVDFLSIGPGPSDASPYVVIARCTNHACAPIARQCFPLDLTTVRDAVDRDQEAAKGSLLNTMFEQLHATNALVAPDAPDRELLVRMVTTTLSCDEVAARPLSFEDWPSAGGVGGSGGGSAIFGCGYAGPLRLDATSGAVFLGLPTLDPVMCVPQLAICAADFEPSRAAALLGL